jgi:putative ABC transport system permease protein
MSRTPSGLAARALRLVMSRDRAEAVLGDLSEDLAQDAARIGAPRWPRLTVEARAWRYVLAALANGGLPLGSDLRWAWRGVRSRRIGSVVHVALVAVAVGGAAVVFSAADAFVFRASPYPNADRLVVFQRNSPIGLVEMLEPEEQLELSRRTDLFRQWHRHSGPGPTIAVRASESARSVRSWDVEPGLFEALGVAPRWGRPLLPDDSRPGQPPVVLIREDVARHVFGNPAAAVGQLVGHEANTMRVVGVMPAGFRFPTSQEGAWRPLPDTKPGTALIIAALAIGAPARAVAEAAAAVAGSGASGTSPSFGPIRAVPLAQATKDPRAFTNSGAFGASTGPRLFTTLLGTAICLALIVCFSVAGLELTSAIGRARIYVVQTALGATRARLIRTAIFETAIVTMLGALAGGALAWWGTSLLAATLPSPLATILTNQIDVDLRAIAFMAVVSLAAAIIAPAPVVWYLSRPTVTEALRTTFVTIAATRPQASFKHALIAGQVALCVLVLVAAALFIRSYGTRLGDKGFDGAGLATVEVMPRRAAASSAADLERTITARLRSHPAVESLSRTDRLLPGGFRGGVAQHLWLQDASAPQGLVASGEFRVDPEYFETMGIRLLNGRFPRVGDSADQVVVDEALARRFWPNGDAVGARFSLGRQATPGRTTRVIVGIASHVQLEATSVPLGGDLFATYSVLPGDAAPLSYVVRLRTKDALGDVSALVRAVAEGSAARTALMDDRYAEIYGDTRIAAGVTSGFGLIALVVAILGLYGVTAFLVAGRRREIGIRLALGAGRGHVQRLVVGTAMRSVVVGAIAGVAGALALSRWIESQLFGVAATDPATYAAVVAVIVITGLVATWRPAWRASRVDPAVTLRAE